VSVSHSYCLTIMLTDKGVTNYAELTVVTTECTKLLYSVLMHIVCIISEIHD
jgi:hypothetical protein